MTCTLFNWMQASELYLGRIPSFSLWKDEIVTSIILFEGVGTFCKISVLAKGTLSKLRDECLGPLSGVASLYSPIYSE